MAGRFIKLYDKMLRWEWFTNANTLQLFVYLLLKASYKDTSCNGIKIGRGQVLTSISKLRQATGQTDRMIRDNLKHLEMTGEVTSQSTNRYRIITIVRYDDYQTSDKQNDKQMTSKMTNETTSKTTSQPTTNIEYIELQNRDRNIEQPSVVSRTTAKRFVPPSKEEILDFCLSEGYGIDVDYLYDYYTSKGWKIGKETMKDWKAAVRNWVRREEKMQKAPQQPQRPAKTVTAQQYSQRDYSEHTLDSQIAAMLALEGT